MYVNTMAANALAPCIARSGATKVLNFRDKQFLVYQMEWFHYLPDSKVPWINID